MAELRFRHSDDVSWIRARLRAAPGGTLACAALVLVTAFLAAALPRAVDGYEDTALRQTVSRASLPGRSVTMSLQVSRLSVPFDPEALLTSTSLRRGRRSSRNSYGRPWHWSGTRRCTACVPWTRSPPTPGSLGYPVMPCSPEGHPGGPAGSRGERPPGRRPPAAPPRDDRSVEAVITDRTAKVMKLRAGSAFHLEDAVGSVMTVRVTGIVAPRTPAVPGGTQSPTCASPDWSRWRTRAAIPTRTGTSPRSSTTTRRTSCSACRTALWPTGTTLPTSMRSPRTMFPRCATGLPR
ncbi:hypothetical protein E4K10_43605 [Streptomyces sp. T1317-0309]|nr:hypothetical protein E4K10_43605 [Streptomyces sp. T1317-0309]